MVLTLTHTRARGQAGREGALACLGIKGRGWVNTQWAGPPVICDRVGQAGSSRETEYRGGGLGVGLLWTGVVRTSAGDQGP